MYRLVPFTRSVLITTDEVIHHTGQNHTLDPRRIQDSIIVAEERFIREVLGFDFYESLRTSKNTVVTSGNKATLETAINLTLETPITLTVGDIVNAREFLTGANLLLWDEFLWKLIAECVMFLAFPENYSDFTSSGIVHNNPTAVGFDGAKTQTPGLKTIQWQMDKKLMERIDPLISRMHQWICKKKAADSSLYLSYTKECLCDEDGVSIQRKSDILLDIYGDNDETGSCTC